MRRAGFAAAFLALASCARAPEFPQTEAAAPDLTVDDCPAPILSRPFDVNGPTKTGRGQTIVVRWSPSRQDVLPEAYYREVVIEGDAPSVVRGVKLTGTREVTLELQGLGAYLRKTHVLALSLAFPDARGATTCSHPGMADHHVVPLKVTFDDAGSAIEAALGPVETKHGAR